MFKTKKDVGIIEVPAISPHLDLFIFTNEEYGITDEIIKANPTILDSTDFTFVVSAKGVGHHLTGVKIRDILSLVDGKRSRYDIAGLLKDKYDESDINILMVNLAYNFIIVSSEYSIDDGYASIFSNYGISPRFYEESAKKTKVHCINLCKKNDYTKYFKTTLSDMHVDVVDSLEESNLAIVLVDDYLQSELIDFNKQRLIDKKKWVPIKLIGAEMIYGPIFTPDKSTVCLHCITNNMRNNREMRGFLEYNKPGSLSTLEEDMPVLTKSHVPSLIISIMRSLILISEGESNESVIEYLNEQKLLDKHVCSYDVFTNEIRQHFANKRPQCLSCGSDDLHNKSRKHNPVELFKADPNSVFTSGGMKATTSEKTLEKYDHLISPLTGIITSIEISSPKDDDWMHVYWSGSNLAIINRNFRALTNSIRSKSAGKGRSKNQAKVSAMCEALERYSGVFNGDEIRKIAKFSDFKEGDALRPNDLMIFSENQYKNRNAIAASGHRFYYLPAEDFDENVEVEWSPVWSITQQKHIWMMCYQLYFSYDPSIYGADGIKLNHNFANPDSNGAASGNTPAEAFVQGFMELMERDAYAIWWYNMLSYPEVDIASFNDPYLNKAIDQYQNVYSRKLWVLDITNDFNIPVFVAISYRFDKEKQDICISAGAHFDPHIALLRAVCELNQYISAVLKSTDEPGSYTYFDKECNDWWQNATLKTDPYLLPDAKAKKITKDSYKLVKRNLNQEVQACVDAVHEKGLEIMVLDQTRPDVGLPVMKVMVPGMRHFWARFGPGRLFDVPVTMGKLDKPKTEAELNPVPVFI